MSDLTNTALLCGARYADAFSLGLIPGIGGDDIPRRRRKSPHRGWDKAEWRGRVKDDLDAIETTLRAKYAELTGAEAAAPVIATAQAIVAPVNRKTGKAPPVDWAVVAKSWPQTKALQKLYQDEMDLRAEIEEEDEILMAIL